MYPPLLPRMTFLWRLWWSPRKSSFSRSKWEMGSSGITRTLTPMLARTALSTSSSIGNKGQNYQFTPWVCPPQKRICCAKFSANSSSEQLRGLPYIVGTPSLSEQGQTLPLQHSWAVLPFLHILLQPPRCLSGPSLGLLWSYWVPAYWSHPHGFCEKVLGEGNGTRIWKQAKKDEPWTPAAIVAVCGQAANIGHRTTDLSREK